MNEAAADKDPNSGIKVKHEASMFAKKTVYTHKTTHVYCIYGCVCVCVYDWMWWIVAAAAAVVFAFEDTKETGNVGSGLLEFGLPVVVTACVVFPSDRLTEQRAGWTTGCRT